MQKITAKAYAKINLTLDVLRKREDNYHDLKMIMQSVSLYDTVTVTRGTNNGITIECDLDYLPTGPKNIAYVAAQSFFEQTGIANDGIHIYIQKKIPVTAGLAGGSSDGAATIRALNALYDTKLSVEQLAKIGEVAGSDVPFCVLGGTAIAEGKGEILTPLPDAPNFYTVICTTDYKSQTKKVFGRLKCDEIVYRPDTEGVINAIRMKDRYGICKSLYNVLEPQVTKSAPILKRIRNTLENSGAFGVCMSGSGPSIFALFEKREQAEKAAKTARNICANVNLCQFVNAAQVAKLD